MAQAPQQDITKKYGQLVAKAWEDPAFKQRLMERPTEVFRSEGIPIPKGTEFVAKAVDDDDAKFCGFATPRYNEKDEPVGEFDRLLDLHDIVQGKVDGVLYFALPPKPQEGDFADEQLAEVAGYLYKVATSCSKSGGGSSHFCGGNAIQRTTLVRTQLRSARGT
jgi:hypothetical protein